MERTGYRILSNTASGQDLHTRRKNRVMSSIAAKRLGLIVSAVLAIGWSGTVLAAKVDNEAAVVAKLYKDFAWQAIASQDLFGDDLSHQNKSTLEKYFAPTLAD